MSKVTIAGLLMALLLGMAPAQAADDGFENFSQRARAAKRERMQSLLETNAPAIVTVKFVVAEEFMGQKSESEKEVVGALVSDDGLVVVANSSLDPLGGMKAMIMGGPPGMEMPEPKYRTKDYRIILGGDAAECDARLVARDSDLDLVWFRITGAGDRRYPHLDLDAATPLQIGDSYETIVRLSQRFDRAAIIDGGVVTGRVSTPRMLFVASGGTGPAFGEYGKLAGLIVRQPDEDGNNGGPTGPEMLASFILPADQLARATEQALEVEEETIKASGE